MGKKKKKKGKGKALPSPMKHCMVVSPPNTKGWGT